MFLKGRGVCECDTSIDGASCAENTSLSDVVRAGKSLFLKQKNRFVVLFRFLGFNLQMPDTKLRPTSTRKSKDKSSKQKFGSVNATSPSSSLNIILLN